jgi:LysM repeat protein
MRRSFRRKNKEADVMAASNAGRIWSGSAVIVFLGMVATAGCVTKESYTQQVNRTTNLQRLLAEEEKRSSDLAAEVTRLKRQAGDLEAQNKLISDQLKDARAQVVRSLEEVGRLQEEVASRRPVAKSKQPGVGSSASEPPDRLDELQFDVPVVKKEAKAAPRLAEDKGGSLYHEVQRGDTLFNIAKRYQTDVRTLKQLNGLSSNTIELGQRLQVRRE